MTLFIQLTQLIVYAALVASTIYLVWHLDGLRRWFMVLFCISFSWSFGLVLLSIMELIDIETARLFSYWLTHIASGGFVTLLTVDRIFFHRGYGIRCPKTTITNGLENGSAGHYTGS